MKAKVRFTGKLRWRLNERYKTYAAEERESDSDSEQAQLAHTAFSRQKTNVVCESEDEVKAVIQALEKFHGPHAARAVTWSNGPMRKAAKRVSDELEEQLEK